jgi:hypothetical protein
VYDCGGVRDRSSWGSAGNLEAFRGIPLKSLSVVKTINVVSNLLIIIEFYKLTILC